MCYVLIAIEPEDNEPILVHKADTLEDCEEAKKTYIGANDIYYKMITNVIDSNTIESAPELSITEYANYCAEVYKKRTKELEDLEALKPKFMDYFFYIF